MRNLILAGKGPGMLMVPDDAEHVWGINDFFMQDKPCHLVVEMHDYEWTEMDIIRHHIATEGPHYLAITAHVIAKAYWKHFRIKEAEINKRKLPLLSVRKYKHIPTSIEYPLKEVTNKVLGGKPYYIGGISYMIAYAVYQECWDKLTLYGINLDGKEEWSYQRPCVEHHLGIAVGRGMDVDVIGSEAKVLKSPADALYGYLGTYPPLTRSNAGKDRVDVE